ARTFSGLRAAGTNNVDMAIHKNTYLREKLNLQFRAECFNLANRPQFGPPGQVFGNAQFGLVSAQANLSRVYQFALKLTMYSSTSCSSGFCIGVGQRKPMTVTPLLAIFLLVFSIVTST